MTAEELKVFRAKIGFTQKQMAQAIGMSERGYQDIETGNAKLRRVHILALERVSLFWAVAINDLNIAFPNVRKEALDLYNLFTYGNFSSRPSHD